MPLPADPLMPRVLVRGPDGGPVYAETPPDPTAANSPIPAEPFNTATAGIFIAIALYWAWVLRGRYRQFAFLTGAIPILLAGGIGGTLYHATRTQKVYFLLDVIPISLLGVGVAVYLTIKLARDIRPARVMISILGLLGSYVLINGVLFRLIDFGPGNLRVNLNYAVLATFVVAPMLAVLIRTRFRHGSWVVIGLIAFAIAWGCRLVDRVGMSDLPMGTHWLWHLFGAISTHAVATYLYRIESENVPSANTKMH